MSCYNYDPEVIITVHGDTGNLNSLVNSELKISIKFVSRAKPGESAVVDFTITDSVERDQF